MTRIRCRKRMEFYLCKAMSIRFELKIRKHGLLKCKNEEKKNMFIL